MIYKNKESAKLLIYLTKVFEYKHSGTLKFSDILQECSNSIYLNKMHE